MTEGPGTPPLGYHQLDDGRELIVTPRRLPPVTPAWGWMLQLYALHSPGSWGVIGVYQGRDRYQVWQRNDGGHGDGHR